MQLQKVFLRLFKNIIFFSVMGLAVRSFADHQPVRSVTTLLPNHQNWFQRFVFGIDAELGGNASYAGSQVYGQAVLSARYDVFDSCQKQPRLGCFQGYVLFPRLGFGRYHESKLAFASFATGVGVQVMLHPEIGLISQAGFGGQFSSIDSIPNQQRQEIGRAYKRNPNDDNLFIGFVQTGVSWDVGRRFASPWLKGIALQATIKLQNGPRPQPSQQDPTLIDASKYATLDVGGLLGVSYRPPSF